ncbi:carbohydrate ABC transporter permease [Cohnella sp.]|uniref:carbohydrate ABC transporter permease n=1 Tax=Cohnella sp. TaxID=1883426 RepID=UPI0035634C05
MATAAWSASDGKADKKPFRWLSRLSYYVLMIALSCFYFYPMIWLVLSSFRENQVIFTSPFRWPEQVNFDNWSEAWRIGHIGKYAGNSAIVTSLTVVCILLFASMAAFAFSKLPFKGGKALLMMFVVGLFMPLQSFFIAQSYIFERLGLKDSYMGLILPYIGVGLPLAVFLLKSFLDSLPKDLIEASRIDGCNNRVLFVRIILPLLAPGMATVAIFSSLNAWNELLLAMLYIQNDDLKTLPVGLLAFSSRYVTNYKLLFSALALITIPMILAYILFHKRIVSGLTEGSLK